MVKALLSASLIALLAAGSASGETAVVRRAADLSAALRGNGADTTAFDLTATVAYVSTNRADEKTNVAVTDPSGATLFRAEDRAGMKALPRCGALARCRGHVVRNVYGRRFAMLTDYEEISLGPAPQPVEFSRAKFLDPNHDFRLCRFAGTLRDVIVNETDPHWLHLSICDDGGMVFATVPISEDGDLAQLRAAIGSRIAVTGICVPYDHSPRLQTGRIFKIPAMDRIEFLGTKENDGSPVPSVEDIRTAQPADVATLGRHRATGRIVAVWHERNALLRTDNGDCIHLQFAERGNLPVYGDRIEATGLPESDLFRLNLFNATWHRIDAAPMPAETPTPISPRTMTEDEHGNRRVNCVHYGRAVSIRGIVRSLPEEFAGRRMYVESGSRIVPVDASALPAAFASVSVGCEVSVAGTCVLEIASPQMTASIPRLLGFSIVLRSPDDVTVLSRPTKWTTGRLLTLIGALLAALIAILAWNTALRRLAEKRGKALADETLARATADLKVYERTRLAVELHDSLAQNLTGVSFEIDAAERLADTEPKRMHEHLGIASRALKSCRDDLRNCLWDLRHQTLESDDMESAILQTLAPHATGVSLAVRFRVPRERISDNTAHAILGIVRELTINAVRHGKATSVKVAGSIKGEKLLCSVRDNGCGFDPENRPGDEQGHYGLLGIRERVNAFEGAMTIESSPGAGTKVTIAINIPQEDKAEST